MACYKPLVAYLSEKTKSNGKKAISFKQGPGMELAHLPCGQCIGCRLERSRQWTMRCLHEKSLHKENCFVTLTLNPEYMKKRGHTNLDKRELQLFMKRLRKKYGKGIRYYHCGEYGPKFGRAHYHILIFGHDFKDKKFWKYSKPNKFVSISKKFPLYTSEELNDLWVMDGKSMGYTSIGEVSFETAAYVARYILKKQNGEKSTEHYVNKETGEVIEKEYTTMSRRPGIGKGWLDKYESDIYPKDYVTIKGREMKPPRYYDKIMEETKPEIFKVVKERRKKKLHEKIIEDFKKPVDERAPSLETQEYVRTQNQKNQTRSYEDETENI